MTPEPLPHWRFACVNNGKVLSRHKRRDSAEWKQKRLLVDDRTKAHIVPLVWNGYKHVLEK